MSQPPGGPPGHPDTEPVPTPEPNPPMPTPPTEPVPAPQPPHVEPPTAHLAGGPPGPPVEPSTVWQRPEDPWQPAPGQGPTEPVPLPAQPGLVTPSPDDRRRRTGLWISVALTTTLLLCGGGAFSAYLLLRDADGGGAPDPASAVDEFLTAIYTRQDASAADELVCREARDKNRLTERVGEIKSYADRYDGPTFRWDEPAVSGQSEERATVSVQLTMSTDDEKTAQQRLTFTTVRKTGWLVCEITG